MILKIFPFILLLSVACNNGKQSSKNNTMLANDSLTVLAGNNNLPLDPSGLRFVALTGPNQIIDFFPDSLFPDSSAALFHCLFYDLMPHKTQLLFNELSNIHLSNYKAIANQYFIPKDGSVLHGVNASYFNQKGELVLQRNEAGIDFNFTAASPDAALIPGQFNALFQGFIQPELSGKLSIELSSNDSAILKWRSNILVCNGSSVNSQADYIFNNVPEMFELYYNCKSDSSFVRLSWNHPADTVSDLYWKNALINIAKSDAAIICFEVLPEMDALTIQQKKFLQQASLKCPRIIILLNKVLKYDAWMDNYSAVLAINGFYPDYGKNVAKRIFASK